LSSCLSSIHFEIETNAIKAAKLYSKVREMPDFELKRKHGKSNFNIIRDGLRISTLIREYSRNKYSMKGKKW